MSIRSDDDAPILEPELMSAETPAGIDRKSFMIQSTMIGAIAVLSGPRPATGDADHHFRRTAGGRPNLCADL